MGGKRGHTFITSNRFTSSKCGCFFRSLRYFEVVLIICPPFSMASLVAGTSPCSKSGTDPDVKAANQQSNGLSNAPAKEQLCTDGDSGCVAGASLAPCSPFHLTVDELLHRYETMEDLQVCESAKEEDYKKIKDLRAAVLKTKGWESAPVDWRRHFFLTSTLYRFLRGRGGDVEKSTVMLSEAIDWFETFDYWKKLRATEKEVAKQ